MGNICYNCFAEIEGSTCPHCGYDPAADEGKYPLALKPGSILNGRYILGRVLGQGGFGITYIAQDYNSKERVAIKEYLPDETAMRTPGQHMVSPYSAETAGRFTYGKEQFLAEAETLAGFMGSENIVNIVKFFEENGTAYLVMEYVDGIGLDQYMEKQGGRLTVRETDRLLLPVMDALQWVHSKGVVHRDISPDNVLITEKGKAKLIDFGAARYSTGEQNKTLDVILKHGFAPKEQYSHNSKQGPFTDIYAMAATYYYAITGKKPPDAVSRIVTDELERPGTLVPELSEAAEAALLKALAVEPSERYQSIAEFEKDLEKANGGTAGRIKLPKNKLLYAVGAGAAALLAVILLISGGKKEPPVLPEAPETSAVETVAKLASEPAEPTPEPGTFEYKKMLADKGDAEAAFEVAQAYLSGSAEVDNKSMAKLYGEKYLMLAADNGNAEAALMMGDMLRQMDFYGDKLKAALEYYEKAGEQGIAEGYAKAGVLLYDVWYQSQWNEYNNYDIKPDTDKMLEYLTKGSEAGFEDASYTLSQLYSYTRWNDATDKREKGEFYDEAKTAYYLKKAALEGSLDAMGEILQGYSKAELIEEYKPDYKPEIGFAQLQAYCLKTITEKAEEGDPDQMDELARYYTYEKRNSEMGKQWYRRELERTKELAEAGDANMAYRVAMAYTGKSYYFGGIAGTDYEKAQEYLDLANSLGGNYSTPEELQ